MSLVFAAIACGGEPDSPTQTPSITPATSSPVASPTPPPIPSPTQATGDCPVNQLACDLAEQLKGWLAADNFAAVSAAHFIQTYTCPGGQPSGAGGPFPLCNDVPAGEEQEGVQIARRYSEGAVISVEAYEAFLRQFTAVLYGSASDEYGTGALQLVAVSCTDTAAEPQACAGWAIIFSGIPAETCCPPLGAGGLGRELLIFFATLSSTSETPLITQTWTGIIQEPEEAVIFEAGGTLFDLGNVYPLN